MKRYMVVVERGESSWGAHVPDLPGCVAVGESRPEVLRLMELTGFVDAPSLGRKGASTMPKSRPPYPPDFRRRIVELVAKGRTPEELARQFEPSAQAIRNWVKQAALDAGYDPSKDSSS